MDTPCLASFDDAAHGSVAKLKNRPLYETSEEKARRILNEELDKLGWTAADLAWRPKGEARKVRIALRLRAETAVTLKWIAGQLHMGTWTHVTNRLQQAKDKSEPNNQHELRLV